MGLSLLIEDGIGQIRAALLAADGRALEIWLLDQPRGAAPALGAVYRGRVQAVHGQTESADIDLGGGLGGMLALRHAPRKKLNHGDALLVQVRREAIDEGAGRKAPVLTGRPVVNGRYLSLAADGQIRRRAPADTAAAAVVAAEQARLQAAWQAAKAQTAPGLALAAPTPLARLLCDHAPSGLTRILVEGAGLLAQARQLARAHYPELEPLIAAAPHDGALMRDHGVDDELDAIAAGTIDLGAGAFLRIEATDALTAIDVNSGPAAPGRDHQAMAMAVNSQAAREIARQLRLQDIGGLVVVDFLDLHGRGARQALEAAFDEAAAADPVGWQRGKLTAFGIMEIIRARHGPSLAQKLLARPRPQLRADARLLALLRQALREAAHGPPGVLVLSLDPALAHLLAQRPAWRQALAARAGRQLLLRPAADGQAAGVHIEAPPKPS
ncbi:MAG: hypothetical protein Tsb0016_19210 [Sphingomonadales bacterium]